MRRIIPTLSLLLALLQPAWAQESWLGIYLQGNKIGWASSVETDERVDGVTLRRVDTESSMTVRLLAGGMQIHSEASSWYDARGNVVRSTMGLSSGGRTTRLEASFGDDRVKVQYTTGADGESPQRGTRTLTIPKGARVVDDPVAEMAAGRLTPAQEIRFVTLDPNTISLVEGRIRVGGRETLDTELGRVEATKVEVLDPRATMLAWVDAKGQLIKAENPGLGLLMKPEPKELALTEGDGTVDLAEVSAIRPDRPLGELHGAGSKLRITGVDLSRMPSDEHQTVRKDGDGWIVEVHPVAHASQRTIEQAGVGMEAWLQPEPRIPARSAVFRRLAQRVIAGETDVLRAAEKLRVHVFETVSTNPGIGVLRSAEEILETREGVCRDHAILLATLLRAAGIPARLASGLVYQDGRFYYHAWTEAWDGERWVGFDSTRGATRVTTGHIKTSQGAVDQAMTSFLLPGARIENLGPSVS